MNEITFNPSTINLNYIGEELTPIFVNAYPNITQPINYPITSLSVGYYGDFLDWLDVYDQFNQDLNEINYRGYITNFYVKLKDGVIIPDGVYNAQIDIFIDDNPPEGEEPSPTVRSGHLPIKLTVNAGISSFKLLPENITLHLVKDNTENPIKNVDVTSSSAFVISGPENLKVNEVPLPIDFNNGEIIRITSSENARSLKNGVYDYVLDFRNNSQLFGKLPVKLIVSQTNNLELQPSILYFEETKGVNKPESQNIYVFDPEDNLTLTTPSWVKYELMSNDSGFRVYKISVDSTNLNIGERNENINFANNSSSISCSINYKLNGLYDQNYLKKFHYTQDSENLILYQKQEDLTTFVKIDLNLIYWTFAGQKKELKRSLEFLFYLNKIQNFDPGMIIHEMFNYHYSTDNYRYEDFISSTGIIPQYQFVSVDFKITEIEFDTREEFINYDIPSQFYLKGLNPKLNNKKILNDTFLSKRINAITRITLTSFIAFNFINISSGNIFLKHNGVIIKIPNSDPSKEILTAPNVNIFGGIIKVSDVLNLKENDILELEFAGQKLIYHVEEQGINSINIFYLDSHDLIQCFEATGEYSIDTNYDRISASFFDNWVEKSKNLDTSKNQIIKINSGYIPRENLKILDEINMSKKAWIIINDEMIEARPVASKFNNISSKGNLHQREIELELINEEYDSIYM